MKLTSKRCKLLKLVKLNFENDEIKKPWNVNLKWRIWSIYLLSSSPKNTSQSPSFLAQGPIDSTCEQKCFMTFWFFAHSWLFLSLSHKSKQKALFADVYSSIKQRSNPIFVYTLRTPLIFYFKVFFTSLMSCYVFYVFTLCWRAATSDLRIRFLHYLALWKYLCWFPKAFVIQCKYFQNTTKCKKENSLYNGSL